MLQMSLLDNGLDNEFQKAITEDVKRGSGFVDGKERIKSMFSKNITKSDRINLLKNEYGIGGRSIPGGLMQMHDSKGIEITLNTGDKKRFTWQEVHDLILSLINIGEY